MPSRPWLPWLPHKNQERIKREIEEQERAERQARLEELWRQQQIEQARRSLLEDLASDWSKSNEIPALLREVARKATECGLDAKEELVEWLTWARAHADRLNPLFGGVDHILKQHAEAQPEAPEKPTYAPRYYWPGHINIVPGNHDRGLEPANMFTESI